MSQCEDEMAVGRLLFDVILVNKESDKQVGTSESHCQTDEGDENKQFISPPTRKMILKMAMVFISLYLLGSEHLRLNHWRLSLLTVLLFIHFLLDTELHGYTDSFFCSVNSVPFVPEKCGLRFLPRLLPARQTG